MTLIMQLDSGSLLDIITSGNTSTIALGHLTSNLQVPVMSETSVQSIEKLVNKNSTQEKNLGSRKPFVQ